jgi:hypothetical protein
MHFEKPNYSDDKSADLPMLAHAACSDTV